MKRIVFLLIALICACSLEAGNVQTSNGVTLYQHDSVYVLSQGFSKATLGTASETFSWFSTAQECLFSSKITEFEHNGETYKIKTDDKGKYITSSKIFNNMKVYQQDINEIYYGLLYEKFDQAKYKILNTFEL